MLADIKQIKIPSNVEMHTMTIEELTEWRDKLKPFYEQRIKILDEFNYAQYFKANRYDAFKLMIENLEQGLPRWHRISNFGNETSSGVGSPL